MSVYKQFLPKDYAVVPFNANKQYNFNSSSAALNNISFFSSSFNSESIDLYNSGNVKYQQINHLYYSNYLTNINNKLGDINYLKHKRVLYKDATIISIPTGLYGHKIKPGSFSLISNNTKIIDDSYGNLIISGTIIDNYITDPRSILLNIGPNKGFERYDLNTYTNGQSLIDGVESYSTPPNNLEYDDSYFLNKIYYNNVTFSETSLKDDYSLFSEINFNGTSSKLKINHDEKFNFNDDNNFSIEFWINPKNNLNNNDTVYIIGKSGTKTVIPSESTQPLDVIAEPQHPFQVYLKKVEGITDLILHFTRYDGNNSSITTTNIPLNNKTHIICNYSSSKIFIQKNANKENEIDSSLGICKNNANIYIGSEGGVTNYFSGSLSQIKIYNKSINNVQSINHYNISNGSPYIGNIFYSNGLATLTHPFYTIKHDVLGIGQMEVDNENQELDIFTVGGTDVGGGNSKFISNIKFQGSHLIYENEYKCNIDEHEYNNTLNPTVRKLKTSQNPDLADFATGSLFKPYITTVGLYNENNELLVVGKLGQPIRTSNETDTTIILRWDT